MIHFIALCAVGAEPILKNELKLLGFKPSGTLPGRVFFFNPTQKESLFLSMFKANYYLRTADRIFLVLKSFEAQNFDDLYGNIYAINWQDYFYKDSKITIDKVRTFKSKLSSEHAIQSVTHKAICEKLCASWKMKILPESGTPFSVRLYVENNMVHSLLDLSGEPLHRRGYRLSGGIAPMRETLAATLLQCMQWKRKHPLHDAFCGSGTIPIEATWFAYNIPPGIDRTFAFEGLACFDKKKSALERQEEKAKSLQAIRTDCLVRITGSDINEDSVSLAQTNAERACMIAGRELQSIGIDNRIPRPEFVRADFEELTAPYEQGFIISNPPFGERLKNEEESFALYKKMANLTVMFPNWKLGFITSRPEFESIFSKEINSSALKKKELKGGNLSTCLYIYHPSKNEVK